MAIDRNSNAFTFAFSFAMVVVVGAVLAFAAMALKPMQLENMRQEKMKNILMSIKMMTADDDMAAAPEMFEKYITHRLIITSAGEVKSNDSGKIDRTNKQDAFNVDLEKEYKSYVKPLRSKYKKDKETLKKKLFELDIDYPIYEAGVDGKTYYIIPVEGTGLWGPIHGYISFEEDMNTIYGATFTHKGETPGLGAEITTPKFQQQFEGKTIFDNGSYVSIDVLKGGAAGNPHAVDGITGGTITSRALGEMVHRSIMMYVPYIETVQKN